MKLPQFHTCSVSAILRNNGRLALLGLGLLTWLAAATRTVQAAGVILPTEPNGFNTMQPGAPSGLAYSPPDDSSGGGWVSDLLDGLSLSTMFSGNYNSNVAANQTTTGTAKDDYILGLGCNLNYLSHASTLTFGGNYRGNYNQYFNHKDYSGYSQGGGVVANYDGGKYTVSANAGFDIDKGSNSNYSSSFVQRTSIHSGLTARYLLSPKTSLLGTFGQSSSSASGGNYSDTSSYDLSASGLWKYSALTEFGPGLRYAYRTGSTQTGRTSIGPTINVNYKLAKKVALTSRLGMDFSRYDNGTSADPTFSASIGLNYQASKLWGMNMSYYRDTQADTSLAGGYTQISSLQLGCYRKVRRATLNLGLGYQTNSYDSPGNATGGARPDQNNFNINTSLSMPVFSNTCNASVFLSYRDQRGGSSVNSYDSIQTGFSISRSF
jgi:hypothetical protein